MSKLTTLIRPHLIELTPYASARDEYKGKEGIFLDANENPFSSVTGDAFNRYPDPHQQAIKEKLAQIKGVSPSQIFLGNGSDEAIDLLIKTFCEPKKENIVILPPTYGMYKVCADIQQVDVLSAPLTPDFDLDLDQIKATVNENTKMIWAETPTNTTMQIIDIEACSVVAKANKLTLVVDNTFSPLSVAPAKLGADIVIHSLTKYINGSSDTVGGVTCASREFINSLKDVNSGASMLLGPTMDSLRSASVMKNLRTLHIRMKQHSYNAMYLAEKFENDGIKTVYPGLKSHPSHEIYASMINPEYGFGGMMTIDVGSLDKANELMELMQERNLGYLAVSLGFYKTLFSAPGTSTSSEIPLEEQKEMGLTDGLIRFSIGLDNDIERTYQMMKGCMKDLGIL